MCCMKKVGKGGLMGNMIRLAKTGSEEIIADERFWVEYLGREFSCFKVKLFTRDDSFVTLLNDSYIGKDFSLGPWSFNLVMGTEDMIILCPLFS